MRYALMVVAVLSSSPALSKLCKVQLSNGHQFAAPTALTLNDQVKGLSGKNPINDRLIMAWDNPAVRSVWMRNTFIPLTAAFVGEDGKIQSLQDMKPNTDTAHSSLHPVIAIIEVSPKESARLGWKRGDYVTHSSCFTVK